MRRILVGAALVAAILLGLMWFMRPAPGESLFAQWISNARGKAWSITSGPDSGNLILVDPSGGYQPREDGYSIHYYVYDRDSRHLCSNDRLSRSLERGCVPTTRSKSRGVLVTYQVFADKNGCVSTARLTNRAKSTRRLTLFVAALPFRITGRICGGERIVCTTKGTINIGGSPLIVSGTAPDSAAAYDAEFDSPHPDVTSYIRAGFLPRGCRSAGESSRLTSAALRYDVTLEPSATREFVFRSPIKSSGPARSVSAAAAHHAFIKGWKERLDRVELDLPDRRCEDCFRASTAYLLMLSASGTPVPGPTKYRLFWVRDCAYIADALFYSGQTDRIPPALDALQALQLPNGGYRARTASTDDELDAPGQAIYCIVRQYRRTGDLKWLRAQWPSVSRTCAYIKRYRVNGILPASVSAEDIGRSDQQHYWDDFWCIRGLMDAAEAARALGKGAEAAQFGAEARSLLSSLRGSIAQTAARHGISYIPNGPQEVVSSSMARGTSCALWPCDVLTADDPLTLRSFDTYWDKWIAPSNGGFVHRDHFWPYAGLDLAQGYVMLGQRERAWRMLDWTLSHDPTRGFWSWPEGMFTRDLTLAEGDMPHGWMCAAVVSTIRNMLVRESGDQLILLSGVPKHWLRPGSLISIKRFPTEFGALSFSVKAERGKTRLTLSGARPRGGYVIDLPNRRLHLAGDTTSATLPLKR